MKIEQHTSDKKKKESPSSSSKCGDGVKAKLSDIFGDLKRDERLSSIFMSENEKILKRHVFRCQVTCVCVLCVCVCAVCVCVCVCCVCVCVCVRYVCMYS